MRLFREFIILLGFAASLALPDKDTEYGHKSKNLFKRPSVNKHDVLSSILEANLDTTNKTSELLEYVDHAIDKARQVLKNIDALIIKEINIKNNIGSINTLINDYTITVQKYVEKTVGNEEKKVYNEDIIMIDLTDMSYRLLYQTQMKILNETLSVYNTPNRGSAKKSLNFLRNVSKHLVKTIKENSINFKSEEIQHICMKYGVCRQYPSLTDHCGNFVNEVLQLPKNKLSILLKVVSMIVSHNEDFIAIVSNVKKDKDLIENVLQAVAKAENLNKFTTRLKDALTVKFEIIHNPVHTDKIKAAALRILLDIIDKSYEKENNRTFYIHLDNTLSTIKKWAKDEITSISVVATDFMEEVFKLLSKIIHSNTDYMKTIYNLIEILVGDNTILHEDYYRAIIAERQEL